MGVGPGVSLTLSLGTPRPRGRGVLYVRSGCLPLIARVLSIHELQPCSSGRVSDEPERHTRSYSQLHTYGECPRRFQLERVEKIPRRPGWWFPGGTAVHATIERYLRQSLEVK
jgi:hypothetical protein